ncbi:unnamed protein product [Ixodes pacificus]
MFLFLRVVSVLPVPLCQNSQSIGVSVHQAMHWALFVLCRITPCLCFFNGIHSDMFVTE